MIHPAVFGLILVGLILSPLQAARKFSVTFDVRDDRSHPVVGADAGVTVERLRWTDPEDQFDSIRGRTDENGLLTLEGKSEVSGFHYGVQAEGHYVVWSKRHPFSGKSLFRWQPWNPTIPVVLKRIRNPVPMYVRRLRDVGLDEKREVALDMVKGAWLPPWGKGEVADVVLSMEVDVRDVKNDFDVIVTVRMPNSGDGLQRVKTESDGSFPLPSFYEAPIDGYEPEMRLTRSRGREGDQVFDRSNHGAKDGYIFRIRTERDNQGNVKSAWYGKIRGHWLHGIYYLNPDGTRNLEYAPKHNLAATLPQDRLQLPKVR